MIEVGEFREDMPLSELIQLAVNGVKKALGTGRYVLDHSQLHTPGVLHAKPCRIDLAGGIVAHLSGFNPKAHATESGFVNGRSFEGWERRSFNCLSYAVTGRLLVTWSVDSPTKKQEQAADKASQLIARALAASNGTTPLETYEAAAQILAEVGL